MKSTLRRALAAVAGILVLLALWPTLCAESESGASSCTNVLSLPLPWSAEQADTWGMAVAGVAAVLVFLAVLKLPQRHAHDSRPPARE